MDRTPKECIQILMEGQVKNLIGLTDYQFELAIDMLRAARYSRALESLPMDKDLEKSGHGKKSARA
ncbi:MAG: hypothetical protein WC886_06270 [Saccharofermentanaceae bacterium]|jgi:hypothetical protein